jgi:protein gp37
MSEGTTIEWTDATWNPLRASVNDGAGVGWACVRVSQGCVNCYAATINRRLGTGLDYTVPALAKVSTYVDEKAMGKPSSWRKPRRVFVCSMSDLFGEWVTDSEILDVWLVMAANARHTFQVLTKRPERMREWVSARFGNVEPLPNVWLGTSVENQATANERIPHLLATPAAVRFLSCEPLLGPVDLRYTLIVPPVMNGRVDWVIAGGESGPRARPMDLEWARAIVEQCKAAGVAVFVKQLGAKPMGRTVAFTAAAGAVGFEGTWTSAAMKLRDRKGGDPAEWPEDLRVRQWPCSPNTQSGEGA